MRVAVVCEGQALTYRELNRRANGVARRLRALGVGPEVLVGLCVERSLEMVVGILAILKAGGAYVPLDPTYPPGRLAFMLEDAAVPVLLTQERLVAGLPPHRATVVALDAAGLADSADGDDLPGGASPDNLAYVIYTSGSTGQPKGTLITHRNVARLMEATERVVRLRAGRRVDAVPLRTRSTSRCGSCGGRCGTGGASSWCRTG